MTYTEWLRNGLAKPGKSGKGLARHLKMSASVVSRMLKGTRPIRAHELPGIAEYIGEPIPGSDGSDKLVGQKKGSAGTLSVISVATRHIPAGAIIAPGVWREGGTPVLLHLNHLIPQHPDPRLAALEQYYCQIEGDPTKFPVCVPYFEVRSVPLDGDLVHVRRTRGSMTEDTLRRIKMRGNGAELRLENDRPAAVVMYPSLDPDETVEIVGLVVGYHINLFS